MGMKSETINRNAVHAVTNKAERKGKARDGDETASPDLIYEHLACYRSFPHDHLSHDKA